MAKVAERAPLASFGLPSSTSARPSKLDVLLAWCRSLAGRQPLGLGEDVGRVADSAQRAQQHSELHGHDGNYHRRPAAVLWLERFIGATSLRGCSIAAAWCGTFQWLLVLLPVAAGRPWASTTHASGRSSWSSGHSLEACPRWYSGKPSAAMWLLELAGHVAVVQHGHAERSWTALLGLPVACGPA